MFCPQCKAEYLPEYTRCADCDVALVDHLPEDQREAPDPDMRFVKLLETRDLTDIVQIKSALDAGGVRYYIQGDVMISLRPFDQPAIVLVVEEDLAKALELLKDVKLRFLRMIFHPDVESDPQTGSPS